MISRPQRPPTSGRTPASKIRTHLRGNVVGYIALFVALSGTAYAVDGPLIGKNTVGSEDIINDEVYSRDVRNGQILSADVRDDTLPNGGLGGADIANAALTGQDVADDTIGSSDVSGIWGPDVADGGLTGNDIQTGSLTGIDISNNSINADDVFGLRGDDDIEDGSLAGVDVRNGSLTGADLEDNSVGTLDVKDGSLSGWDIANGSLRGDDIDEDSLELGCRTGMVKGFALIEGSSSVPNDSWSSEHVSNAYNCTGGAVKVRDLIEAEGYPGRYSVIFEGQAPEVALAMPSVASLTGAESDKDNFIAVAPGGSGVNNDLYVVVHDNDQSAEHGWFYLVVL